MPRLAPGRVWFHGRGTAEFIRQATVRHFARASAGIWFHKSDLLHYRSHRLDCWNARRSDGGSTHAVDDMAVGTDPWTIDPLVIQLVALPNGR